MNLNHLFQKSIRPKLSIPFPLAELKLCAIENRNTLKLIDNWIDDKAFKNSFFNYGVPDFIKVHLNKPIDETLTYTDYLLFMGKKYFKDFNYLEIGVSVGKNFYQMINGVNNAQFTGFDIEEINPIIKNKLDLINKIEWETLGESLKTNKSSLSTYSKIGKKVNYLSADIWDSYSWSKLTGNKFNIIFSDALHTPEAIYFECEMLMKYKLLDSRFIIMWDDLIGEMKDSFFKIIRKYKRAYKIKEVYILKTNGWVGEHESKHQIGIISNFKF